MYEFANIFPPAFIFKNLFLPDISELIYSSTALHLLEMISEIIILAIKILLLVPNNELPQKPGLLRVFPNVMEHQGISRV